MLDRPSETGVGHHLGVATNYLASLDKGDKLHVAVRPSPAAFHPPLEPDRTPVIYIAAGSGLAPFRGFIQERASMLAGGRKLAPAMLFYGCREPGKDDLYADELAEWEKDGVLTIHRAYSRTPKLGCGPDGSKYVQDALAAEREAIVKLWKQNAKMYICGSRAVGKGVKDQAVKLRMRRAADKGEPMSEEEASKWWEGLRNTRYATDVFD